MLPSLYYYETVNKYHGRVYLTDYKIFPDRPSRFRFALDRLTASADASIATEGEAHGTPDDHFVPDEEGRRRIALHVAYERSRKNRAMALRIHGTTCAACGFNFNKVYGAAFARGFIEVHHVRSITEKNGGLVNPQTDLIPLCSNCHSMAHRERGRILSLGELRSLIAKNALQRRAVE